MNKFLRPIFWFSIGLITLVVVFNTLQALQQLDTIIGYYTNPQNPHLASLTQQPHFDQFTYDYLLENLAEQNNTIRYSLLGLSLAAVLVIIASFFIKTVTLHTG